MLNVQRWPAAGTPRHLVVLCHGYSANAAEMAVFVESWAPWLPGAAFMAPDAPQPFEMLPSGFQWFSLQDRTPTVLEAGARAAAPLLNATIDAECTRLGIPPDQVALVGFSQGAMMALHAGLRRSPVPACILAYSGALLDTPALGTELGGHPPVLLVHGEQDGVVPFSRAGASETALRRLGIPVETCWRRGLEHSIDAAGLAAGLEVLRRTLSPR